LKNRQLKLYERAAREESQEMKMQNCPQSENMVAYLYGEVDDAGKKDFEKHLSSCALCTEEMAAFGIVRQSVVGWRDDVLSNIVTPAFARDIVTAKQVERRTAFTAIREFFTLSPLWLRGATTFAALVLIALVAFAVFQLIGNKGNEVANGNDKPIVVPSPQGSPKEEKKTAEEQQANDIKVITPEKSPDVVKEKVVDRKPERIKRKAQMAQNKTPRRANKPQRLKNEEIFGEQIAYSEEEDSLYLSSLQNPPIKD
jgi:hypothetical protein